MNFTPIRKHPHSVRWFALVAVAAFVFSGCGSLPLPQPTPTPTFTPTATPSPTPTPAPTTAGGAATPAPTPQVTVPDGFTVVRDERLGYSFAVPRGWSELDLRGAQFQGMASMFGMGDQLSGLNEFLDSPEGQMLGKLYITDLTAAMFGGLPTVLAVVVADAPGYTADQARTLVEQLIQANAGALGSVSIRSLEATTINNLPAVRGVASADLSGVGMNASAFGKVVGLLANDQIYVMALLTQANQQAAKEPVFDQIIGSFRPE
jgi:hypothetical protein